MKNSDAYFVETVPESLALFTWRRPYCSRFCLSVYYSY